jgi:N-acetylmuramoyl-L-alanine amidase
MDTPGVIEAPSPNQDERPAGTPIDMLVLHYTGMQTGQAAIDRLRDPAAKVSSHYVVEEDGQVWRLATEDRRAWHAGVSHWRGHQALNDRSIGIEIVNPGHEWGYRRFPPAQMAAVRALCLGILGRHPIPPRNVVGHSDIAPDRKQDPGELFDWPGLAQHGIGLWPTTPLPPAPMDAVPRLLTGIGYPIPDLATTVRAFQRRWRPGGVTGEADAETRARVAAVWQAMQPGA